MKLSFDQKQNLLKLRLHIEQSIAQDKSNRFTFQDLNLLSFLSKKLIKQTDYSLLSAMLDMPEDYIAQLAN